MTSDSINSEMCNELTYLGGIGEWYNSTYVSNYIIRWTYQNKPLYDLLLVYVDDISCENFCKAYDTIC